MSTRVHFLWFYPSGLFQHPRQLQKVIAHLKALPLELYCGGAAKVLLLLLRKKYQAIGDTSGWSVRACGKVLCAAILQATNVAFESSPCLHKWLISYQQLQMFSARLMVWSELKAFCSLSQTAPCREASELCFEQLSPKQYPKCSSIAEYPGGKIPLEKLVARAPLTQSQNCLNSDNWLVPKGRRSWCWGNVTTWNCPNWQRWSNCCHRLRKKLDALLCVCVCVCVCV